MHDGLLLRKSTSDHPLYKCHLGCQAPHLRMWVSPKMLSQPLAPPETPRQEDMAPISCSTINTPPTASHMQVLVLLSTSGHPHSCSRTRAPTHWMVTWLFFPFLYLTLSLFPNCFFFKSFFGKSRKGKNELPIIVCSLQARTVLRNLVNNLKVVNYAFTYMRNHS